MGSTPSKPETTEENNDENRNSDERRDNNARPAPGGGYHGPANEEIATGYGDECSGCCSSVGNYGDVASDAVQVAADVNTGSGSAGYYGPAYEGQAAGYDDGDCCGSCEGGGDGGCDGGDGGGGGD